MGRLFDFTHLWVLDASTKAVFDVLADPLGYDGWWPQMRSVERANDGDGAKDAPGAEAVRVIARSALPYSLDLRLTRRREDRAAGVLEVWLSGDLHGWSRMVLYAGDDQHTRVSYRQQVVVTARWLAPWTGVLAPVLIANHAWMMRGGERGLRRRLRRPSST